MTEEQIVIVENLKNRINAELDDKTGTVKITSEIPDADAAAAIAEIATDYLTSFITEYRINKVKKDLDFIRERYQDAHDRFEKAQLELAQFRDQNVMITTARAKTEEEKLQTQYNLAFNVYNGLAQRLEQAKIQVQEKTPVFTELEPIKVPLEKSWPKRGMVIMISLLFGAFVGVIAIIIGIIFNLF